jgi:hypothetical protein
MDILESLPDCKKDITVNIDSGGWCYIKGEYKLDKIFPQILRDYVSQLESLTLKQQLEFQYALFFYIRCQLLSIFADFNVGNVWDNHYPPWDNQFLYVNEDCPLTFKVDLKCRRELAPVEVLELLKEQSHESVPGARTLQDPSPDGEFKLQVERGSCSCPSHTDHSILRSRTIGGGNKSYILFSYTGSCIKIFV